LAKKYEKKIFLTRVQQQDLFGRVEKDVGPEHFVYFKTGDQLAKQLESELPAAVVFDENHVRNLPEFVEDNFTKKPGLRFIPAAVITDDPEQSAAFFSKCHFPVTLIRRDSFDELLQFIESALKPSVKVKFWGVRGSTPCANSENIYYGGNTSCVQIQIPGYDKLLILDSGTGIRNLGNFTSNYSSGKIEGDLFITHPHWDHIQGFPFFMPFYKKGNTFNIHMPEQYRGGAKEILSGHLTKTFSRLRSICLHRT